MTTPPRAPDVPGYAILGLLGSGGLGAVWRARNAAGAEVALKVVEPRRPVDAATADRLFRREALAGLNLDHPGIVRALDAVKARDGRPCIVFEFAEGPTLRDAVKARGALPPEEALRIASRLAAALDHAHRHGVVHGDVSPGNVLLSPGGARLLDFGLVAELEAEPGGSVFATPGFTAPEVMAGGAPTAASDLHALGKTLAFALQGAEHPLRTVVERLCRADPAARYRSAAELGLDLDAIAAGETPLGAALSGAKARMAARRTGPWILAAVGIAAVAGFLLLRDQPPAPVPPPPVPRAPPPDPLAGRIEALRVLLGREPVDFGAARALAEEIRRAGRSDPLLADFDSRWKEAAAAIASEKSAEARHALAVGDRGAWRKVLLDWPAAFADAPEAVAMAAEWARWDKAARVMATQMETSLAAAERDLAAGTVADPAALDADLARMQVDPATPPELRRRAGELRGKTGAAVAAQEKAAREAALRVAIEAFLQAAAKPEPMVRVRALLYEAIAAAEGSPVKADLEEIRTGADKAQVELERALAAVVGKPWASARGDRFDAWVPDRAPVPDELFDTDTAMFDVIALLRDREQAAAWLLVRGWVANAGRAAPKECAVRRVLDFRGRERLPNRSPHRSFFNNVAQRLLSGPQFLDTTVSSPGEREKSAPGMARAVEAYVADDLLRAWGELNEVWKVDPHNPEAHVLMSRVVLGLARSLPTATARCFAMDLANQAWGKDPTLAAAPALAGEIALGLHEDLRPTYDGFLTTVILAKKASISLGRAKSGELVTLAERLHRDGDDEGAREVLRAAESLGVPRPKWAADLFR